jgi:hypothetical protein
LKRYFYYLILTVLLFHALLISQDKNFAGRKYAISAGMGINIISFSSLNEYLKNNIPYTNKDSIKSFSPGFEVNGAFDIKLTKKLKASFDYIYLAKSATYNYSFYIYNYSVTIHKPTLILYYYIDDPYYSFNFGVGINYSIASIDLKTINITGEGFKASGFGINGLMKFMPKLSNRLSAYLTGKIFYDSAGKVKKDNGEIIKNNVTGEELNLDNFGATLILGIAYNF